jgi:hypothetical protein
MHNCLYVSKSPGNMQVFSDFEHVLTQTQENGARTVSSGELLECAQNVLSPNAVRTYMYILFYYNIIYLFIFIYVSMYTNIYVYTCMCIIELYKFLESTS